MVVSARLSRGDTPPKIRPKVLTLANESQAIGIAYYFFDRLYHQRAAGESRSHDHALNRHIEKGRALTTRRDFCYGRVRRRLEVRAHFDMAESAGADNAVICIAG
jgi:hypothetical protein